MTDTDLGPIAVEAAAEGDTSEGFEGTMTFEFAFGDFHLLPPAAVRADQPG